MIFKQIPVGVMANFTYVFGSEKTGEAAVVDPTSNLADILRFAEEKNLRIGLIFATHDHADHTSGISALAKKTGAKVVAHKAETQGLRRKHLPVDIEVEDGQKLKLGDIEITIIHTPGHTPGSMCLLAGGKLMTGDTLFVGNCGRTDLPGGSTKQMFESLHKKLKVLPDDIEVYPGHDYGDRPSSTIGREKKTNPTLAAASFDEFMEVP
ncbi:MAG: MBL fold metallo-hydrolase [Candidatus Abyssobacteria bacterium SURF_5]|uniref:MBL fold metallo-hydrolase n=1 Tax=Abyssobacteria bacterium (strain SURF_5) TaxID=2093360 RepID=A0A3A4NW08_ABYX5|nr:MAG: MBL fold metallo-hydrolase [Candidatus Abyssubacteria bacterium SURF_5]